MQINLNFHKKGFALGFWTWEFLDSEMACYENI